MLERGRNSQKHRKLKIAGLHVFIRLWLSFVGLLEGTLQQSLSRKHSGT